MAKQPTHKVASRGREQKTRAIQKLQKPSLISVPIVYADKKKKATFNLDTALHKRLKIAAATSGREMVEIVQEALEVHLQKIEKLSRGNA
jgi:hypothetical protein